jgi:hypothetical protein
MLFTLRDCTILYRKLWPCYVELKKAFGKTMDCP